MAKRFAIPSMSDIENSPKDDIPSKMLFTQYKQDKKQGGDTSGSASTAGAGSSNGSGQAVTASVAASKPTATAPSKPHTVPSGVAASKSAAATANKPVTASVAQTGAHTASSSGDTPAVPPTTPSNSLIVSNRQRGNPLLKHIRNVSWEFGDIVADYQMAPSRCALFLSLRYHALNPAYIHERLKQLGHSYELRVMLVQCDVKDTHHPLKELASICVLSDCTLLLAWSAEAAARYLETYKSYEDKPPDLIMEKTDTNFVGRVTDVLTTVKKVNKTDASTLLAAFGTVRGVVGADREALGLCPGLGPQKAQRLYDIFHEPFLNANKSPKKAKDTQKKQAAADG